MFRFIRTLIAGLLAVIGFAMMGHTVAAVIVAVVVIGYHGIIALGALADRTSNR